MNRPINRYSLRAQLLFWVLLPLFTLSVLSTVVAWLISQNLIGEIYDTELINSADSVVARIEEQNHNIVVDMPPDVVATIRHGNKDTFYYQVLKPDGTFLYGDQGFPPRNAGENIAVDHPLFSRGVMNGATVHIALMKVPTPDTSYKYVYVQVAETPNTRRELVMHVLISIVVPQLLLITSAAVVVWLGVGRGLQPLRMVQQAVSRRSPGDLRPVAVKHVPVELVSLIEALNNLLIQINEDMEAQRRFVASAAHQLRTPLAGLKTYVDIACRTSSDQKVDNLLNKVNEGINRMSHLIGRLLTLARSEAHVTASRSRVAVDLNDLASAATTELVDQAIRKNVELEFEALPKPAQIYGDMLSLHDLVVNLVENAVLYTPPGGHVLVRISDVGGITLVVEDDGPGIALELRERVFERFFRVLGTDVEGSGLGLSIVKEVADAHRASIIIDAAHAGGKGTRVLVKFPHGKLLETSRP